MSSPLKLVLKVLSLLITTGLFFVVVVDKAPSYTQAQLKAEEPLKCLR